MNTWDFLIQREGEQTWSLLDSLAQFPAGNYRIMARTSRAHQPLDIRITYYSGSDLTARKNQHYSRRTDAKGLLSILPQIELTSGTWEISCRPDIMGELYGEIWQQKITLEVCSNSEIQQQESLDLVTENNLLKPSFEKEETQLKKVDLNSAEIALEPETFSFDLTELLQMEPEKPQAFALTDDSREIQEQDILEGEIVSNSEELALAPIKFRSINYVIQLFYVDYDSSIIFDIEMIEPERPSGRSLDLPDPAKMNKPLYKTYLSHRKTLPPKLYPHLPSNKAKRSIQLAKFQPDSLSA